MGLKWLKTCLIDRAQIHARSVVVASLLLCIRPVEGGRILLQGFVHRSDIPQHKFHPSPGGGQIAGDRVRFDPALAGVLEEVRTRIKGSIDLIWIEVIQGRFVSRLCPCTRESEGEQQKKRS